MISNYTDLGNGSNRIGCLLTYYGNSSYTNESLTISNIYFNATLTYGFNTGQYPILHRYKLDNFVLHSLYNDYDFTLICSATTQWSDSNNISPAPRDTTIMYVREQPVNIPLEGGLSSTGWYEIPSDNNAIEITLLLYRNDSYYESDYYSVGYEAGYQDGYTRGINSNEEFTGVFGLIGGAFESIGGFMSVPVIGGLTIGSLITIPLTITIVITIFRMLRK